MPGSRPDRALDYARTICYHVYLKYKWINGRKIPCIFISAIKKENIEKLRDDIYKMVAEIHAGRYPFNNFLW